MTIQTRPPERRDVRLRLDRVRLRRPGLRRASVAPGTVYRAIKLGAALALVAAGVVQCPCGGWEGSVVGAAAGTALFGLLAREIPRLRPVDPRPRLRRRAPPRGLAAGRVLLRAAVDEVLWRGWLTSSSFPPPVLPYSAAVGVALFALAHFPRQGLRGVGTHLLTGAVFTVLLLGWGLAASIIAHFSYNLWVLRAGRSRPADPG